MKRNNEKGKEIDTAEIYICEDKGERERKEKYRVLDASRAGII